MVRIALGGRKAGDSRALIARRVSSGPRCEGTRHSATSRPMSWESVEFFQPIAEHQQTGMDA